MGRLLFGSGEQWSLEFRLVCSWPSLAATEQWAARTIKDFDNIAAMG
jgi:hypothetical protein